MAIEHLPCGYYYLLMPDTAISILFTLYLNLIMLQGRIYFSEEKESQEDELTPEVHPFPEHF